MSYLTDLFKEGNEIAHNFAIENEGKNNMIFPCGFAWIELQVKKSDKLGKQLGEEGLMKWDPYKKAYTSWVHDHNQSMLHKASHAKALAKFLSKELFVAFTYRSNID
jgi:hypothetical protein